MRSFTTTASTASTDGLSASSRASPRAEARPDDRARGGELQPILPPTTTLIVVVGGDHRGRLREVERLHLVGGERPGLRARQSGKFDIVRLGIAETPIASSAAVDSASKSLADSAAIWLAPNAPVSAAVSAVA